MTIPNAISLGRLVSAPIAVWLVFQQSYQWAFWLFSVAAISDGVDGFIAKRFNAMTERGAILDPIADKALLIGVFVALGWLGHVPGWLVVLIVLRDAMILVGFGLLRLVVGRVKVRPHLVSKLNTVMQIVMALAVLGALGPGIGWPAAIPVLVYAVAATTVLSGLVYGLRCAGGLAAAVLPDALRGIHR